MGFFEKIKQFHIQLAEVENSISTNKSEFLEIYERNLQLEKEISERTKELDVANQRMLTLRHILDMMKASKPLSSVLDAIVKMLQGELGYRHSCIIKKTEDADGIYMQIINQAQDELSNRVNSVIGQPFETIRMSYTENGIFAETLSKKSIVQSTDFRTGLKMVAPDFSEDLIRKILNNARSRSFIVVPLNTINTEFGWLVVFSPREEAEQAELDFLRLFAQQIELAITIADLFEAVKNQAVTDPLTTLYNRRYFEENLNNEVVRAKRMKQPFTVIGLDLDHLKQINDNYGHSIGDAAIKTVADVLKKNARAIDVAARMGGEEFNLLLPGVDSIGGSIAAERIRSAIEACEVEQIGNITASVGVATFFEHSSNVDELLELVDQAMYMAKRNGRNQVQLAKAISEVSWQEIAMNTFMKILCKGKIPVSKNVSEELCKKLSTPEIKDDISPKDMLYSVADVLAKTYNPRHSKGITKLKVRLAIKMAKVFNLSTDEVNKLRLAVLLYDIGNLMLPSDIWQKSGPLSDDDKEQIKKHPLIAAREILEPITEVKDIIPIIEHHHENWDGSGYPGNFSGEKIPIASQIILIVDAYFALIEPRSYRAALSSQEALDIIKNDAAKKWNPKLVDEFVSLVERN